MLVHGGAAKQSFSIEEGRRTTLNIGQRALQCFNDSYYQSSEARRNSCRSAAVAYLNAPWPVLGDPKCALQTFLILIFHAARLTWRLSLPAKPQMRSEGAVTVSSSVLMGRTRNNMRCHAVVHRAGFESAVKRCPLSQLSPALTFSCSGLQMASRSNPCSFA